MSEVNHSERAHALLSASGASRWMSCTPSARMEDKFPESTSVYAEEGTLAHELGDVILRKYNKELKPAAYKKQVAKIEAHELYSPEMPEEVAKYTDYVKEQFKAAKRKTKDAKLFVEKKIDLTMYIEDGFGTGDANIVADGVLEVIDLKYGKGLVVSADNNPQLKLYGVGVLYDMEMFYDIKTVKLTIVQPRLDALSTWEISAEDLKAWAETEVKSAAIKAYAGEGETKPGSWCHFCKAAPTCKALAEKNLEIAKHDFADPNTLTDAELIDIYSRIDSLTSWAKKVSGHVFKEALAGKAWEGYKLVEGRSNRKIVDEEKAKQLLIDNLYAEDQFTNTKLKGIGDLEKLVGKKEFPKLFGDLVVKPEGAPTLVPESDKRDAMGIAQAQSDFK